LPAVEPRTGGEHLVEPVCPQCLADLDDQLSLSSPQQRPGLQPDPSAQALGRPCQQRRLLGVTLRESQPGKRGQGQGHAMGAVGSQAKVQPFIQ
jgi:hypothetical protein